MGTSLGVTTAYLAAAGNNARIITMEGAGEVAALAKKNFEKLQISNAEMLEGNFDDTLPGLLDREKRLDFVFIDGNHRYEPTANIAGYRSVLLAATLFPRYFPMFMTAAGSIAPAKVLILGAGVAGLQAIATARRLGAVVEVSDTRPAVKEEVMSLGAKFIEVDGAADASKAGGYAVEQTEEYKQKQQERLAASVAKSDIIITTAQIPGKKAPLLISEAMLDTMKPGSVIIDLAASTGGNVFAARNNETVQRNGVTIVGNSNLAADMPFDASKLYGKNVLNFLQLITGADAELQLNFDDDIVKGSCITHGGNIVHERVEQLVGSSYA
eukprot:jgi/Mesen1/10626/ME000893S10079